MHRSLGVRTSAWSPLGRGTVLGDNVLQEIADKYGKTPAQVVIRWHIQLTNGYSEDHTSRPYGRSLMSSTLFWMTKTWKNYQYGQTGRSDESGSG